jgi:hypothetical protein
MALTIQKSCLTCVCPNRTRLFAGDGQRQQIRIFTIYNDLRSAGEVQCEVEQGLFRYAGQTVRYSDLITGRA